MRAEIIAVGTELLLGETINSNAAWVGGRLAQLGVDVYYHVTVGDNPKRIQDTLQLAASRSNILIFTGGLGPTDDDLTVATIADYFKTSLITDEVSLAAMKTFFTQSNRHFPEKNIKQALRPELAEHLQNPIGTAPGLSWDVTTLTGKPTLILAFPGVPRELYALWPQAETVIQQFQQKHSPGSLPLFTKMLNFVGIGESTLVELLAADLFDSTDPTVAPYAAPGLVKLRLATKAMNQAEAEKAFAPVQGTILDHAGDYFLGEGTLTLDEWIANWLKTHHKTLGIAESCTGGLVSSRMTDIPGSSAYTTLNVVTYSYEQKTALLNVPEGILQQFGAVSHETARAMAAGMLSLSDSDFSLAITGIAGPDGGMPGKPVGLVYIGVGSKQSGDQFLVSTTEVRLPSQLNRAEMKLRFSNAALLALYKVLKEIP